MKKVPCKFSNREDYLNKQRINNHVLGAYSYKLIKVLSSLVDEGRLTRTEVIAICEIVNDIATNIYKHGFIDAEEYCYIKTKQNK